VKRVGVVLSVVLAMAVASCNFKRQADAQFGDQHFKTAIALVELYKIRHGVYPERLSDLDFLGDWDRLPIASVTYSRLSDGYELNLTRGWVGKPELRYPPEFWKGLGLKKSNVKP
jgi:hypothetical protein